MSGVKVTQLALHTLYCTLMTTRQAMYMHVYTVLCVCIATDMQKSHDPTVGKSPIKINNLQIDSQYVLQPTIPPSPHTHIHKGLRGSAVHDMDISLSIY